MYKNPNKQHQLTQTSHMHQKPSIQTLLQKGFAYLISKNKNQKKNITYALKTQYPNTSTEKKDFAYLISKNKNKN